MDRIIWRPTPWYLYHFYPGSCSITMTSSHSSRLLVCPDSHFLILGYCISTWSPLSHSVEASLMVICRVDEGMFARLSTSSALQTMYRLYYLVFSVCLKLWYLLLIIIIALPICSNFWLNLFDENRADCCYFNEKERNLMILQENEQGSMALAGKLIIYGQQNDKEEIFRGIVYFRMCSFSFSIPIHDAYIFSFIGYFVCLEYICITTWEIC
jgi:hypothetical protein